MAVGAEPRTEEGGEARPKQPTGGQGKPGHTRSCRERRERPGDPPVPTTLQRLAAQAARAPDRGCTTLAPLSDADLLRAASRQTSQTRAPGLDGGTAQPDAAPLGENLHALRERLRRGRYQATPVERVWSEQDDGGQRPIGKPAFADKRVQRAVARRLEAMDEQDFDDGSDGFRRGRRAQEARHKLRERGRQEGLGGIGDAESRGDFDRLDRTQRQAIVRRRVKEGSRRRLIGQWRRAGVMEDGVRTHPETGVGPGGDLTRAGQ
jgi:RNA-directed DNA polymerase